MRNKEIKLYLAFPTILLIIAAIVIAVKVFFPQLTNQVSPTLIPTSAFSW